MNLAQIPYRVLENADRRVLGAFRFVDSVTGLPVIDPVKVEARQATLIGTPGDGDVPLGERSIKILQNRSGLHVVLRAPFFDGYTDTLLNPPQPAETQAGPLRLRLAVRDAGPYHLPREFEIDFPRDISPQAANSVFTPEPVALYRAPHAPIQDGWVVLRVLVTRSGSNPPEPIGGVLIRIFQDPRRANDFPIGGGMTDWRDRARGEALVSLTSVQRFRAGSGNNVVETQEPIVFEATRDTAFTGAPGQLPNGARLLEATAPTINRPPGRPPGSQLQVLEPTAPVLVRAGREYVVHLAMP